MADLAQREARGDSGELRREISSLRSTVAFLRSSLNLVGRATVVDGRSLLVRGLLKVIGNVSLVTTDGTELLRLGDMTFGRGLEVKRDNGTPGFTFAVPLANATQQRWSLWDRNGDEIVSENAFGAGLGRPYLALPFQPVAPASGTALTCGPYGIERSTTSGTFETLFAYDGRAQNQFLDFKFAVVCSDGSTAGEVQVVDLNTGAPRPGFFLPPYLGVIPAGTTTLMVLDPTSTQVISPVSPTSTGAPMSLGVQVRRTAGAGTITLAVAQSIGG